VSRLAWVGAAFLLLVGCSASSGSDAGAPSGEDPVGACDKVANAVGAAAERCGLSGPETQAAFLNAAACGACTYVTLVGALVDQCAEDFGFEDCGDVVAGVVPADCKDQLDHPACPPSVDAGAGG
jgi:hypothetical protein